jgi:hypothetical protein
MLSHARSESGFLGTIDLHAMKRAKEKFSAKQPEKSKLAN